MNIKKYKLKISDRQKEILKALMDKSFRQNELQQLMGITSPGLLYHLNILERYDLIIKETILQIGNAKINEISINPFQLQRIRYILDLKIKNCTLITGFGELAIGYRLPNASLELLKKHYYKINRIVCFTTKKAEAIRKDKLKEEKLVEIHQYYHYDYEEYRNLNSSFFSEVDDIILEEIKEANLIIDITPLSKLYSFEMLKKANKYGLLCFYIGQDEEGNDKLIWMSKIKIEGEMVQ